MTAPSPPHGAAAPASAVPGLQQQLQALVRSGLAEAPAELSAALESLLSQPAQGLDADAVECLLLWVQWHHLLTRSRQALHVVSHAVAGARVLGNAMLQRKALSFEAVTRLEAGDFPGAVDRAAQALDVAAALPDPAAASVVWNNLGLALRNLELHADALRCFDHAAGLSAGSATYGLVRRSALNNSASEALLLGDALRGLAAAREAIALNPSPQSASEHLSRALAESNAARLQLALGAFDAAAAHAAAVHHHAGTTDTVRNRLLVCLTEGTVCMATGRHTDGEAALREALSLTRRHQPSELRDVLGACVQAFQSAGQPDVALVYLHELADLRQRLQPPAAAALPHQVHLARLRHAGTLRDAGEVLEDTRRQLRAELRARSPQQVSLAAQMERLAGHSEAAESADPAASGHARRVGRLAALLAREVGLEGEVCRLVEVTARLHDIGMSDVPAAVLQKPGPLDALERSAVQRHVSSGAERLRAAGLPALLVADEIVSHHHERWDGLGYPAGLAAQSIPLLARLTALAECFDALVHPRPHRPAFGFEAALEQIERGAGSQFDPRLAAAFLTMMRRLRQASSDLDAFLGAG